MKNSSNNEMDVLLRALAKRTASVSPSGNGEQQAAGHLDADELNAFAERAMPAAARARYTAHLVDCSHCRKLVAELSASAGLPPVEIKVESEAGKSFWQKLPALLSPQVLRFAVPALAILVVTVVAITTFRQRSPGFMARTAPVSSPEPLAKTEGGDLRANDQATQTTSSAPPAANQNKAPAVDSRVGAGAGEKSAANEDKTTTVDSPSGFFAKDVPAPPAPSKAGEEAQPTFAPEPKPAAVAQPQAAAKTEANKNEPVAKEKIQIDGADNQPREARDQNTAGERGGFPSRSRKAATAARGGAVQSVESRRIEDKQEKRADEDEQTVAVGGRRFRKQGNSWIDTAYDSSRAAITVIRGSEQYRALVADEPGLGTIAERLAGEVIVVWKGRAYRIR